jgi:two-component system clock-associated histidine kinase SasA
MRATSDESSHADSPLQLLLFVDRRPSAKEQVRQVRSCLKEFRVDYDFALQIVDVGEQPYLAEHFRLMATPALIKIHPEPRQTLAGSDLVVQLRHWWPYWQRSVEEYLAASHERPKLLKNLLEELEGEATKEPQSVEATRTGIEKEDELAASKPIQSITRSAEILRLSDEIFRLKQEKEELEHQLRFKDQIIAMLAHDLRNPLTAASLALETLEMGYQNSRNESRLSPTLTAQLLQHARTQTRTIDRMITDILQAARGTTSGLKIHPQPIDLGNLCQDVLGHLKTRLQSKDQQITTDIPSDLPAVLVDQERVRQVLMNLMDNAIKYTPANGKISVSMLHRTTQKVQVSICDNGPGIPKENQEHIFEDRYRLERDEKQEGYGIGLSLCQRIVRAHYGQIWVDSTPNEGSCFHFTLPVYRS